MNRDTICVQGGYTPGNGEPRQIPIIQSTTFKYATSEDMGKLFDLEADGYFYSRLQNPTCDLVAKKICELEGGTAAMLTSSGQAANFFALFNLCEAGDHIVASSTIYGGTFNLFGTTLPKLGIECRFFDTDAPEEEIDRLIDDKTRLIFAETVANPAIIVLDFEKISRIAKRHNVVFVVDNTLATPVLCTPLEFDADIVIHSTTKYMDGHAAALGGMIVDGGKFQFGNNPRYASFNEPDESYHGLVYATLPAAFAVKCRAQMMRDMGAIMSPQNAFLTWLGCDTLALRMEKHCSNAKAVAAFLDKHPKIEWVKHPSLPSDKYHSLAEKYLPNGTGGMMSFGIKGDLKRCARFMEALKLVTQETHVADVRSCVLHPASTTHRQLSKTDLAKAGVPENLIRLSVGIENPQDIIQDLSDALDQI